MKRKERGKHGREKVEEDVSGSGVQSRRSKVLCVFWFAPICME